jgi:hypothetical protein
MSRLTFLGGGAAYRMVGPFLARYRLVRPFLGRMNSYV